MKRLRIVAILLLCLALVGSVACSPFGGGGDEQGNTGQLAEVVRDDLTISISGGGNIAVSNDANLTFSSGGKIDGIYVEEGDVVWEGRLLARLDTSSLELALTKAEAAVVQAEAAVVQAQATEVQAEANLEQADYDYKLLKRQNIHGSRRTVAELELEAAELSLEAAGLQITATESQLVAAEEAVVEAQKQLDEATLTAPFDGVVADVYVDEGDTVSTTTTVVYLIDLTTMELSAELDEIDIPDIEPGQRAVIEVDALPALTLEGEVGAIRPVPTLESGVVLYEVEIEFAVPQNSGIRVGMSAEADIVIDERSDVLLLPDRAIRQDSQGDFVVLVMTGEQLVERSVVVGISDGFYTEITSGLEEGEMVLVGEPPEPESPSRGGIPFH